MSQAKLVMRICYGPKREMTILEAPGDNKEKPMIRIANKFLLESGFTVGDKVEVEYSDGFITINKI